MGFKDQLIHLAASRSGSALIKDEAQLGNGYKEEVWHRKVQQGERQELCGHALDSRETHGEQEGSCKAMGKENS